METLVGLVPNDEHVLNAKTALQAAGFATDDVSVLHRTSDVWQLLGGRKRLGIVFRYAFIGGLLGLVAGGFYGIPAGLLNCSEMGCPFTTSTALLVAISFYWVIGGGFLGALVGLDRLEHPLYSYVEGVRRGAALFAVEGSEEKLATAACILKEEAGLLVQRVDRE